MRKADIQVTPIGKSYGRDGTVYYKFNVKNLGPGAAPNISAYREAHTKALIGNGFALANNTYFTLGSLNSGQSMTYTVACNPAVNMYCAQVTLLTLNNAYDTNHDNNIATIY